MRYTLFATLLLSTFTAVAEESPYDKFSAKNNIANNTNVEWVQVSDVRAGCDAESVKRGLPRYTTAVEGCSFWNKTLFGNTCLIITPITVDYWTFGHELRHCFQGKFHK
jgi:hypothetical protein